MQQIKIDGNRISKETIEQIQSVIQAGGLVVFPSDTVLGVMAKLDEDSIRKVDELKKRTAGKSYAVIFDTLESVLKLMKLPKDQQKVLRDNTPGLFTFVLRPEAIYNDDLKLALSKEGTIGIRVPESGLMRLIASKCLYFATSANLSGMPPVYTVSELEGQLDISKIDLIVEAKSSDRNLASTVVDLTGSEPKILRQGSGEFNW
jgi:tRNA threonylcarbamoyl adenosine modification protein (Sua5/YciO/YrdC/YwlC family)